MSNIRYVKGDATKPNTKGERFSSIVHIVNNCGQWGAGFVLALSAWNKRPEYRYKSYQPCDLKLGKNQFVDMGYGVTVVNMIAQDNTDSGKSRRVDYHALDQCLESVAYDAQTKLEECEHKWPVGIHMPRIGCGIGGGTWDTVEFIIERNLRIKGVNVTVYDLE